MFEATEITHQNNDWITLVFLFIFIVLTLLKVLFKDRLLHENTFFFSKKYLSIYYNKEKGNIFNLFQTLFFIVQLLGLSLLFYFINIHFQFQPKLLNFQGYILIFLGVSSYFSLRYLTGLFLSFLLNTKNEFNKIVYDKMSYSRNLILWILPFLVLSVYLSEYKELLFEITFLLFLLVLILRYVLILLNNKKLIFNNLFYFILYLCALEIAPLIIVLKLTI